MSLDGTIAYDPALDQIFGPNKNMLVIFATRISPLMIGSQEEYPQIPDSVEEALQELCFEDSITSENWASFNDGMTMRQSMEFGGEEKLLGYIVMKLKSKFPELILPSELESRQPQSWTQFVSRGGLHLPSYDFLNLARRWNSYFEAFHNSNNKWKLNKSPGVLNTLSDRISSEFPTVDIEIIKRFVKIRTFIRIKFLNEVIQQAKHKKRNLRKRQQFGRSYQVALSESDSQEEESECDIELC
jgi:hypothetical protein